MRALVWMAAVGALAVVGPGSAAGRTLHALDDYALLGRDAVRIGAGTVVESGQVGVIGGTVEVRHSARVVGNLAGDTVALKRGASAGSLTCRVVSAPAPATCGALTTPVAELSRLRLSQLPVGALSVDVTAYTRSAPLPAGEYGPVTVGSRAELILAGGSYTFESITIGTRGRLQCQAKCRIQARGAVLLRLRASLGPAPSLDARLVRLDLESSDKAFTAVALANVAATVYAPRGAVLLGRSGHFEGAFVGRSVVTGTAVRIRLNSAL